jgi:hypothetical protein
MNKPIRQVWTFRSDSNPDVEYQTLQYADGTTSCNCKGWTRRVAGDGSRSCKHTRLAEQINALRTWAAGRARFATSGAATEPRLRKFAA